MPLDRQSIEKKDFPIGRRGYEPEAVDAHLERLAAEVEALQRDPAERRGGATLALAASEQVRAIVEAAEKSAADIEAEAESEAERTRADAASAAERTRSEATEKAREHVGKVSEATALMLQRVDAMEQELNALLESLRTGANRVTADLSLLESGLGDLRDVAGPPADQAPASAPASSAAPPQAPADASLAAQVQAAAAGPAGRVEAADVEPAQRSLVDAGPEPESVPPAREAGLEGSALAAEAERTDDPPPAPPVEPVAAPAAVPLANGDGDGDVDGARLVALNMALNGSSRDETDAYLAANFDLADRAALLDEVYASVDG